MGEKELHRTVSLCFIMEHICLTYVEEQHCGGISQRICSPFRYIMQVPKGWWGAIWWWSEHMMCAKVAIITKVAYFCWLPIYTVCGLYFYLYLGLNASNLIQCILCKVHIGSEYKPRPIFTENLLGCAICFKHKKKPKLHC